MHREVHDITHPYAAKNEEIFWPDSFALYNHQQNIITMKMLIKNTLNKVVILLTLLVTQVAAFASDGNMADEGRWHAISRMPQFWVGVVLFFAFLVAGLSNGRKKHRGVA